MSILMSLTVLFLYWKKNNSKKCINKQKTKLIGGDKIYLAIIKFVVFNLRILSGNDMIQDATLWQWEYGRQLVLFNKVHG